MEAIAIDTNVFLHLFNEDENKNNHIDYILNYYFEQKSKLCIDDRGVNKSFIRAEYEDKLSSYIFGNDEEDNKIYILRYWMNICEEQKVAIDQRGKLFKTIIQIIIEKEKEDRAFVGVALTGGFCLITNDKRHILDGPAYNPPFARRNQLLGRTMKKLITKGGDIVSSREAFKKINGN